MSLSSVCKHLYVTNVKPNENNNNYIYLGTTIVMQDTHFSIKHNSHSVARSCIYCTGLVL